jgi:hypothetical protein
LHEIHVAVDLGDAGRAIRAAASVDTSGLSSEKHTRMLIDIARAYAQRRQVGEAVAALRRAETVSPELTRGHAVVRQLVSDLMTMQNPPSAELAALSVHVANWLAKGPSRDEQTLGKGL